MTASASAEVATSCSPRAPIASRTQSTQIPGVRCEDHPYQIELVVRPFFFLEVMARKLVSVSLPRLYLARDDLPISGFHGTAYNLCNLSACFRRFYNFPQFLGELARQRFAKYICKTVIVPKRVLPGLAEARPDAFADLGVS